LRHCATSLEVAGLISDAVVGNLNLLEPQELIPNCVEIAFNTASHSTSAGEVGREWYKLRGPCDPEGGPGPYYVAYVFVFLGSVII